MEGVATTRRILRAPKLLQKSLVAALRHDCLNLAQSASYSAIVSLFPALIVCAAALALLPDTGPLRADIGEFFGRFCRSLSFRW